MKETAKYGIMSLMLLLLLPGFIKTAHIFADHQHTFCNHYAESHFHAATVDCDIFHFQQSTFPSVTLFHLELFVPIEIQCTPIGVLPQIVKIEREEISSRGPPMV